MLSIVGASLSYFVLYTAHLQCYFAAMQLFKMQSSYELKHTHASSRLDVSSSPSVDSHGIAERQCLSLTQQASLFELVLQELPRLVDLVSCKQSAEIGFLIALHHRGSSHGTSMDVP